MLGTCRSFRHRPRKKRRNYAQMQCHHWQAAQDFPEYRTQEFIGAFAEALKEGKIAQIMYVPTEAISRSLKPGSGRP
jgi:hypothetical protein